jgi:hypothetical protein
MVSGSAPDGASWVPPGDDELTWFRALGPFSRHPLPLEYSLDLQAFAFGFTRALESLYFPMYELKTRLIDGHHLYFAMAPSAWAEVDVPAQLDRMRDSALRFTRDLRAAWTTIQSPEMEGYLSWLSAYPRAEATAAEVAASLRSLRRTRANQWFASTRAVFAPAALLASGIGRGSPDEAAAVVREVVDQVVGVGGALLREAELRVGRLLERRGVVNSEEDILWLRLEEAVQGLREPSPVQDLVARRRSDYASPSGPGAPPVIGPALPRNAARMYLIREILRLLG